MPLNATITKHTKFDEHPEGSVAVVTAICRMAGADRSSRLDWRQRMTLFSLLPKLDEVRLCALLN